LVKAQKIVEDRVHDLEGSGADVVVDGSNVIATLARPQRRRRAGVGQSGMLYVRPVIHAIPSQALTTGSAPSPAPPPGGKTDLAQRIAEEKALRQSTE
jgi:preprotein translocase subunit SecD